MIARDEDVLMTRDRDLADLILQPRTIYVVPD